MMSIIQLSQIRMYCSKETRVPAMGDVKAIDCFKEIKQFFIVMTTEKSANYSQGLRQTVQGTTCYQVFGGQVLAGTSREVPLGG